MATKSFLKNVNIKSRDQARRLADALEYAQTHAGKEVVMSHAVTEIRGEQVKAFMAQYGEPRS